MRSPKTGERIPNHTYHYGKEWSPLISSTAIKTFLKSPAAFRWPLPPSPDLAAKFAAGSLAHLVVFEPDAFEQSVITLPSWSFQSADVKARWVGWAYNAGLFGENIGPGMLKNELMIAIRLKAEKAGKLIATPDEIQAARAIALSVQECSEAQDAIHGCVCEMSWRTDIMRARPDAVSNVLLVDLKTTSKFDWFARQVIDLSYPISMAHYESVLNQCGAARSLEWVWIAVESTPFRSAADGIPRHRVQVHVASADCQADARERWSQAIDDYAECCKSDQWPDYIYPVNEITYISSLK